MTLAGTLSALTLQGRGDSNDDDIYAEEDVDLRWFLLQTCILIFAMVTCVRCITACIAYRDAQLYDQLMTNNANFANNGGGTNPPGRRRWVSFSLWLVLHYVLYGCMMELVPWCR